MSYKSMIHTYDNAVAGLPESTRKLKRLEDEINAGRRIIASYTARIAQAQKEMPRVRADIVEAERYIKENRAFVVEARDLVASLDRLEKQKNEAKRGLKIIKEWNKIK